MTGMSIKSLNFGHLGSHDAQLLRIAALAERYCLEDPNTSLLKMRQLTELLAQLVASRVGQYVFPDETQYSLLGRLKDQGFIPSEIGQLFEAVRKSGNAANHRFTGSAQSAISMLRFCWHISVWFHRTFTDQAFTPPSFVAPQPAPDETAEIKRELNFVRQALDDQAATAQERRFLLELATQEVQEIKLDRVRLESLVAEAEKNQTELRSKLELLQQQSIYATKPSLELIARSAKQSANSANLSEEDTRALIDQQLRDAGWEADTESLRFSKGARPEKGRNRAIAEWPTESGPADYVFFAGLTPLAAMEGKRRNLNASAALKQAERYCEGFEDRGAVTLTNGPWGVYRLPFAFASNGRPYLRQVESMSGVWFRDVRLSTNLGRALDGWYTPDGLQELLERNEPAAMKQLESEEFNYGFPLRDYQRSAIQAAEAAVATGKRAMLLAMATGTGKTKTCIALIYRLLKVQRFRRVLFLVDRRSLGEQAANTFKDTRMENLQTFADIFGLKELSEGNPDTETKVHVATIQGMVKRLLFPNDDDSMQAIDQYDCIVVDECHRGYLLDRELSDTELEFRSFEDYISKYRRVLDYFDAVKIGLTATPALHTTEIFGPPIYTYSYREAVIDGYLIDHEPPVQIKTELSHDGIRWLTGEEVKVFDSQSGQIDLFNAPDEIKLEIQDFNRRVITQSFNEVVCNFLANELDPFSKQKTLVFCATDVHADMVVGLLKNALAERYGSIDDDAVQKITGAADKPEQLIRRFKNEVNPNVAVTVDLLTTGIDVPEICNLVFLRRVNSRILYDQMLGRATRLCPEVGKQTFRVFDVVQIYDALSNLTDMKPVVVDPKISFTQLIDEITTATTDEQRTSIRNQLLAKLQRKKMSFGGEDARDFETKAGVPIAQFIRDLKLLPLEQIAQWFTNSSGLGEVLDRIGGGRMQQVFISHHADALHSVEHGYGNVTKPEDYLEGFAQFIRDKQDELPLLKLVLTRPRELTRKDLRDLALKLSEAGYTEISLATAWQHMTNQDIAAGIVGFILAAAEHEQPLSLVQRVDTALQRMLADRDWTKPQRDWLTRIAAQTKANQLVDKDALEDPDLLFKRDGGGLQRLDRLFDGRLLEILDQFNSSVWQRAA